MTQPGCLGVPSVFSFTSRICGKCPHFEICQSKAHAALLAAPIALSSRMLTAHEEYRRSLAIGPPDKVALNTSTPLPKSSSKLAVRTPPTDEQERTLLSLPVKASDYLRKLIVRGMDKIVLKAAGEGVNAFTEGKHRPYHLALEMLFEGGLTKPMLRTAYREQLGWSEAAAFSQVSIIWKIFPALNLAVEQGCALIASPSVRCKNDVTR